MRRLVRRFVRRLVRKACAGGLCGASLRRPELAKKIPRALFVRRLVRLLVHLLVRELVREACAEVCAEACAGGLCGRQKIRTKSAQSPHKLRTKPNPPELSGTSRNSMEQRFWNSAGLKAVSLVVVGGLAPRGPKTRDWLFHAALPSKNSSTSTTSIEVINQN